MSAVRLSLSRVGWIATNTWREALRQRLFVFAALLAVGLVAGAQSLREFNFGTSELKFLADFGFGALTFFGSLLAIVVPAQLFLGEIENRTALTLLAKPVRRAEFVAGKFFGVWLVLLAFAGLVGGALLVVLYLRERALLQIPVTGPAADGLVAYSAITAFVGLQWLKFGLLAAITILIASYARTILFTIFLSFLVLIICHLQHLAHDAWQRAGTMGLRVASGMIALLFPNFQLFNVGDRVASGEALPLEWLARIGGYAAIYLIVVLALAAFSFRRREV